MPFENAVVILELKGSQIYALINQFIVDKKPHPLSGLKIYLNKDYNINKIMELKKNPNVDPKRNSVLFFQIGLVAVLILTYVGIELKSEDPRTERENFVITDNLLLDEDDVVLTLPPVQRLPPPRPPAPEVIELVKNEIKLEAQNYQSITEN